jgi:cell division protein FtsB
MSNIRSLVSKASQKVGGSGSSSRKRTEQRERTTDAWFPVRVTEEPAEEQEVPLKRKRIAARDKGKQTQVQDVAPSRGVPLADEGLFQLPRVWSQSDRFGPQASLYLGDSELKAIRDLGTAGRARAVTEGVVSAMRALEVAVFLNNSYMEEAVRADALAREQEATTKKVADLEAEVVALKASVSEKDQLIAFLEEEAEMGSRCRRELTEARAKFAAEKRALEDALRDATQPGEDETEDTAVLSRPALVYRLEELERNLVGVVRHCFDNAIEQLKLVNPGVQFRVDGVNFLKYVRNGEIVYQDDDGHV